MAEGQESSDKPRSRAKFALVGVLGAGVLAAIVILVTSEGSSRHPSQRASPVSVPSTAPAQPTSTRPVSKPTGPPPGGPPAKPPIAAEQFGASVNRLFNDRAYGAEAIDAQLSALRATGATLARSDAFWEATEPSAPMAGVHLYAWTFDDEIAGALAAHGL